MPRSADRAGLLALALLATPLGGCAEHHWDRRETVSFHAGDAVAANRSLQTVDPWSPAAAGTRLAMSGQRAKLAIDRYNTNTSPRPQGLNTSSIEVKASGGGAGGAGGAPAAGN